VNSVRWAPYSDFVCEDLHCSFISIGGPGDQLIGKIVADNFGTANNWPLGAMLVIPILLVISAFLLVANRFGALGRTST